MTFQLHNYGVEKSTMHAWQFEETFHCCHERVDWSRRPSGSPREWMDRSRPTGGKPSHGSCCSRPLTHSDAHRWVHCHKVRTSIFHARLWVERGCPVMRTWSRECWRYHAVHERLENVLWLINHSCLIPKRFRRNYCKASSETTATHEALWCRRWSSTWGLVQWFSPYVLSLVDHYTQWCYQWGSLMGCLCLHISLHCQCITLIRRWSYLQTK